MKKVLFATTALVASAGIASAQGVELSGSAEMGIFGGSGIETQFWSDIDVKFTLSGETDNGLTFGATIDLDEVANGDYNSDPTDGGADKTATFSGEGESDMSVFLSGNFGTITMGDTDGAFDWALTEVGIGSAIADDHTTHIGFNFNSGLDGTYDGQIVRYDYSFGDFAFAVSAELDDTGAGDPVFGIGGKYSGDLGGVALGVGIGYQDNGVADIIGISLTAKSDSGIEGRLNWSELSVGGATLSHVGVGVGYTMDALTVSANWGQFEAGGVSVDGWGGAANYDLGGGATVQFGYGNSNAFGVSADTFSLGVAMSF